MLSPLLISHVAPSAANTMEGEHPATVDRTRMVHGDLEREVEDQLAGGEDGKDLRPGPAASAQPGERATEKDPDGQQHRRIG